MSSRALSDKAVPQFAFLSKPPPPPPSSPAYSSIITWTSLVQPGSPAPTSPSSRRPSLSRLNRRPSISISHARAAPGYTSVFVHLPKTPTTPPPYPCQRSTTAVQISKPTSPKSAHAHIPMPPMPSEEPPVKRTGLSRFRSFSFLRSRPSKPKQQPSIPPSHSSVAPTSPKSKPTKSKKHPAPTEFSPSTIVKRKQAKYSIPPPLSLANELALMQLLDGGTIDSHAKTVMEAQAKAAAGSGAQVGVGDVYRDGNGGIWWDADEEWEYTHLLADTGTTNTPTSESNDAMAIDWEDTEPCFFTDLLANQDNDHFERKNSVSSQDSDLDLKYLVTVPEHTLTGFNAPVEDRVLASHKIGDPGMSILSLPSRPRRKALHLNKAEFLVDLAAFGPRSPKSSVTPSSTQPNPKGQARRRPAPLKLAHQSQNAVVVVRRPGQAKTPATLESAEKVRKDFFADSFAPLPASTKTNSNVVRSAPAPPQEIMNKKPSRMNMRGLFGRKAN